MLVPVLGERLGARGVIRLISVGSLHPPGRRFAATPL